MALCPECGGRLGPVRLFRWRPRDPIQCPWCRSHLAIRRWVRWLCDGLLVGGGSTAVAWSVTRYLDSGSDIFLFWGLGAGLLVLAVAGIIETAVPLETRVPRDFRDWKKEMQTECDDAPVSTDESSWRPEESYLEPAERR